MLLRNDIGIIKASWSCVQGHAQQMAHTLKQSAIEFCHDFGASYLRHRTCQQQLHLVLIVALTYLCAGAVGSATVAQGTAPVQLVTFSSTGSR